MQEFVFILAIIFVTFAISFVLINLRHAVTGNEFRGTCSTNNPMLKDKTGGCNVCGKTADEACKLPKEGA